MIRRSFMATLSLAFLLVGEDAWAQASKTLFARESSHNHVIVTQEGPLRIMHFRRRRLLYRETVMDVQNPLKLVNEYSKLMMAGLIFSPQPPRKILMIGLGGGLLTRVLAHYFPNCFFDNVELDQVVVDAAERFFEYQSGGRMRTHVRDGRVFLRRSRERYDMIILDAYRGGYVPFHLKTQEFLELVRDHLTPSGVVIGNLHGGTRLYDSDRVTYANVFSRIYAFVGHIDTNVILVANRSTQDRLSREQILQRAQQLQAQHRFVFDLPAILPHYQPAASYNRNARMLTDDYAPVEALNSERR